MCVFVFESEGGGKGCVRGGLCVCERGGGQGVYEGRGGGEGR